MKSDVTILSLLCCCEQLKKGDEMTWVDVGGGTARVLEYFDTTIIKKYFKKIVIIDVASSLLEVARQRVCAMKLEDIVQIIELDFTEAEALSKLSIPVHTVDIVTFSYSLSMISKPTIAIENASKLLKRKQSTATLCYRSVLYFWKSICNACDCLTLSIYHLSLL